MTNAGKWWTAAALLAAIMVAVRLTKDPTPGSAKSPSPAPARQHPAAPNEEAERETADSMSKRRIKADWEELLAWLRSDPRPSKEEVRARLLAIRIEWTRMDPQARAEAIALLLATGEDVETGMNFQVGPHGQLAGWPTLRVFLLDVLATSDPEMAATIAKQILDQTNSADEFATALRSLTREGLGRADDGDLLTRLGQMLDHEDWQSSRGFAEGLDLARLLGSPAAARQLVAWDGNSKLKSVVMDEFTAAHPAAMYESLDAGSSVSGPARASLMARADPSDPGQRGAVDAYLKNPDLSAEEAATFLKVFPLRSASTGYRLYGELPIPYTHDQIRAGDQAALRQVQTWMADPALEKYAPDLQALHQRLETWNAQKD